MKMSEQKKKIKPSEAITLDPSYLARAKDWEEFIGLWTVSKEIDQRNQWFKGDILNKLVNTYGEGSLSKFAQDVKESIGILEHLRRTSRAFPIGKRFWNLTWTHYFLASCTDSYKKGLKMFDGRKRYKWIRDAHDNHWSTTRLQEEIKKAKAMVNDKDVFNYYLEYIKKVGNILMHVEKDRLKEEEKDRLIHKLLDVYSRFMVYLKEEK